MDTAAFVAERTLGADDWCVAAPPVALELHWPPEEVEPPLGFISHVLDHPHLDSKLSVLRAALILQTAISMAMNYSIHNCSLAYRAARHVISPLQCVHH